MGPCHKLHELLVIGSKVAADLIFLTSHISVPFRLTGPAILFVTFRALKSIIVLRRVKEHKLTPRSRAPWHTITVSIHIVFEGKFLVLLDTANRKDELKVLLCHLFLAFLARAYQRELPLWDQSIEARAQAIRVEDMATVFKRERLSLLLVEVHHTYPTVFTLHVALLYFLWFVSLLELLDELHGVDLLLLQPFLS